MIFLAQTVHSLQRQMLFDHIQALLLSHFQDIIGFSLTPHAQQLFTPMEGGGFGVIPYGQLHEFLFAQSCRTSSAYVCDRGYMPTTPNETSPSLQHLWKQNFISHRRMRFVNNESDILTAWPINHYLTFDDDFFVFIFRLRLNALRPQHYICPIQNTDIASFDERQYTEHVLACSHCSAFHRYIRHENVVHTISRILRYNGVTCRSNPKDFPKPDRSKGGPDITVYTTKIYAGDVTVCKDESKPEYSSSLVAAYSRKIREYTTLRSATQLTIAPLVYSAYGYPFVSTIDFFKEWSSLSDTPLLCLRNLILFTQSALLRGTCLGLINLHAKFSYSVAVQESCESIDAGTGQIDAPNGGANLGRRDL